MEDERCESPSHRAPGFRALYLVIWTASLSFIKEDWGIYRQGVPADKRSL